MTKYVAVFKDAGNCEIGEPVEFREPNLGGAVWVLANFVKFPKDAVSVTIRKVEE